MRYATSIDLLRRSSITELLEIATPADLDQVDGDLLRATLNGENRYQWLTDEIEVADATLARIEDALVDADETIDAYLAGRYTLPLSNPARVLTAYDCDLALYRLYGRHEDDGIKRRHTDAIRFLEKVASGVISLGVSDQGKEVTDTDHEILSAAPERIFSSDTLSGY